MKRASCRYFSYCYVTNVFHKFKKHTIHFYWCIKLTLRKHCSMELALELGQKNPYIVFPNEIWEQIISNIGDTDDIVSLLQAFPQLTGLCKGKQFSWLVGEVMPFLMPKYFTKIKDIYNCRLVSKTWKNAVGTTLETHPDRLAYKSSQVARIHENHFCYQPVPRIQTSIVKMLQADYGSTPQNNNPFLGRYLKIKLYFPERKPKSSSDICFGDIIPVLEKYGQHLHHIYFVIRGSAKFEEEAFVRATLSEILRSLSYLPNLKYFKLAGSRLKQFITNLSESPLKFAFSANISVPKLEAVDLSSFAGISANAYHQLLMALVGHEQVKVFGLHYAFWNKELAPLFPNLRQLILNADDRVDAILSVRQMLQELKPEHLGKLLLRYKEVNIFELLQVVSPYNIKSLELVGYFPGDINETGTNVVASSITDLKMRVYVNQSYKFLKSLPSLQYLYFLHDHEDSDGYESDDYYDRAGYDPMKFLREDWSNLGNYLVGERAQLGRLDFMWEALSSLKIISIYIYGNASQIVREYNSKEFKLRYSAIPPGIFYYRYE